MSERLLLSFAVTIPTFCPVISCEVCSATFFHCRGSNIRSLGRLYLPSNFNFGGCSNLAKLDVCYINQECPAATELLFDKIGSLAKLREVSVVFEDAESPSDNDIFAMSATICLRQFVTGNFETFCVLNTRMDLSGRPSSVSVIVFPETLSCRTSSSVP